MKYLNIKKSREFPFFLTTSFYWENWYKFVQQWFSFSRSLPWLNFIPIFLFIELPLRSFILIGIRLLHLLLSSISQTFFQENPSKVTRQALIFSFSHSSITRKKNDKWLSSRWRLISVYIFPGNIYSTNYDQ